MSRPCLRSPIYQHRCRWFFQAHLIVSERGLQVLPSPPDSRRRPLDHVEGKFVAIHLGVLWSAPTGQLRSVPPPQLPPPNGGNFQSLPGFMLKVFRMRSEKANLVKSGDKAGLWSVCQIKHVGNYGVDFAILNNETMERKWCKNHRALRRMYKLARGVCVFLMIF